MHLLAADDGDVEVALAAEEERGGVEAVGVQKGIGNSHPDFGRLPGQAEFVVLENVLAGAEKRESVGKSRAAR